MIQKRLICFYVALSLCWGRPVGASDIKNLDKVASLDACLEAIYSLAAKHRLLPIELIRTIRKNEDKCVFHFRANDLDYAGKVDWKPRRRIPSQLEETLLKHLRSKNPQRDDKSVFFRTTADVNGGKADVMISSWTDFDLQILNSKGQLSLFSSLEIMVDLLEQLDFIHFEMEILHLDIKPENILVNYSDDGTYQARFTDFEFAAPIDNPIRMAGTSGYFDPDVIIGNSLPDRSADLHSLRLVFLQTLTGKQLIELERLGLLSPIDVDPKRKLIAYIIADDDKLFNKTLKEILPRYSAEVITLISRMFTAQNPSLKSLYEQILAIYEVIFEPQTKPCGEVFLK